MKLTEMEQSDSGGPGALKGYNYQNFAAAYYVLSMLSDKTLISVRCEVIDDIDLVYENHIEYVQVKTTDNDTKWSINEFAGSDCKFVPPTGRKRKDQKVSLENSILHKSLACDKLCLDGYFRILTSRDVKSELQFLKIDIEKRDGKEGREKLLESLRKKINKDKLEGSPDFVSPNGNDLEYWVNHSVWQVVPSKVEFQLLSSNLILKAASEKGIYLNAVDDVNRILNTILIDLSEKSSASRILKSTEDKSYRRKDFVSWFYNEIERYSLVNNSNIKVYSTDKQKLTKILNEFYRDNFLYKEKLYVGEKSCIGLEGKYQKKEYTYSSIAKAINNWLPELLLLPSELADHSPQSVNSKFAIYKERVNQNLNKISYLIARALLHSAIRTEYGSQPIAASLYVDDSKRTCFDNIHILINHHEPDNLLMGFSYLVEKPLKLAIDEIVNDFDELIECEAFDTQKEKILEVKSDNHLIKHDIDDILKASTSLDQYIDRFKFVFFIGYESSFIACNKKDMLDDYNIELQEEVVVRFKRLVDSLVEKSDFYEDLNIEVFLYPIPNLNKLYDSFKDVVSST